MQRLNCSLCGRRPGANGFARLASRIPYCHWQARPGRQRRRCDDQDRQNRRSIRAQSPGAGSQSPCSDADGQSESRCQDRRQRSKNCPDCTRGRALPSTPFRSARSCAACSRSKPSRSRARCRSVTCPSRWATRRTRPRGSEPCSRWGSTRPSRSRSPGPRSCPGTSRGEAQAFIEMLTAERGASKNTEALPDRSIRNTLPSLPLPAIRDDHTCVGAWLCGWRLRPRPAFRPRDATSVDSPRNRVTCARRLPPPPSRFPGYRVRAGRAASGDIRTRG